MRGWNCPECGGGGGVKCTNTSGHLGYGGTCPDCGGKGKVKCNYGCCDHCHGEGTIKGEYRERPVECEHCDGTGLGPFARAHPK